MREEIQVRDGVGGNVMGYDRNIGQTEDRKRKGRMIAY